MCCTVYCVLHCELCTALCTVHYTVYLLTVHSEVISALASRLFQEHRVSHLVCATDQNYHTEDLCKSGDKRLTLKYVLAEVKAFQT